MRLFMLPGKKGYDELLTFNLFILESTKSYYAL